MTVRDVRYRDVPREHTLAKIKEILDDEFAVDQSRVHEKMLFTALGLDSLDMVEFAMEVERLFDMDIPDEDMVQLRTIGDLVTYVHKHRRV